MYKTVKQFESMFTIKKIAKFKLMLLLGTQISTLAYQSVGAQTVTITDTNETNIRTSTASGGSPANVVVADGGEISVESGVALTVDSNNTISNSGLIVNSGASNSTGVLFETSAGPNLMSTFNFVSTISVGDSSTTVSGGSGNYGILIDGPGIFQGNIIGTEQSGVSANGDNSAAFSLKADMIGGIDIGNAVVVGANSNAVEILGDLTGDLNILTNATARQTGNHGLYIDGNIIGGIRNVGLIASGTQAGFDQNFDPVDATAGIASVRISGNVTGGFANDIIFQDSNQNIVNVTEGDDTSAFTINTSSIEALAGGYAVWITPEKDDNPTWTNISLGNTNSFYGDYSIMNQGTISSRGINAGQEVTTIFITGATQGNTNYSTTLDFGIYNGLFGSIEAVSLDANATGLHIGNGATVPEFVNNGSLNIDATISTDTDGNAVGNGGDGFGIIIDPGGTLSKFENNNAFIVAATGTSSSAYGVLDNSGTLNQFRNSGLISTTLSEGSTGKAVAVDLSNNISGVDFFNDGNITGDIFLGSGNSTIALDGLTTAEAAALPAVAAERAIDGTIFLSGGSSTLTMSNNSQLKGGIVSPNGQLAVTLDDQSTLTVDSSFGLKVSNLSANDQSTLIINIDDAENFVSGLEASGSLTFSPESQLSIQVESVIVDTSTFRVIEAGTLTLDLDENVRNSGTNSLIYDIFTEKTGNVVDLTVRRRGATELGLSQNIGAIYEASIPALINDKELAAYIGGIETSDEFNRLYKEMTPNSLSQISRQVVLNNNNLSTGAISGQLDNLRHLLKIRTPTRTRRGIWIEEFAGIYNYDETVKEKGADVFNFGLAAGYELLLTERGALGANISYNVADVDLTGSGVDHMTIQDIQLGLYSGYWINDFFVEAQGSAGYLSYDSEREVVFGDVTRHAIGEWSGIQYSGVFKAGYEAKLGSFSITPTAGINYNKIKDKSYLEQDGGAGINLNVAENNMKSLRSDLRLELAHTTEFKVGSRVDSIMRVGLHGGWAHEFNQDPLAITAAFENVAQTFTLNGDPIAENNYQAGLGLNFTSNYIAFSIKYDAEWRDGYLGHLASMNLRVRF